MERTEGVKARKNTLSSPFHTYLSFRTLHPLKLATLRHWPHTFCATRSDHSRRQLENLPSRMAARISRMTHR